MASYAYSNSNPIVPPNPDQQSYPAYGQAPNYGAFPGQPAPPTTTNYPGYDQQSSFANNQQSNYSSVPGDYNSSGFNQQSSYGGNSGGGYQQKGGNFRGGNNRNSGGQNYNKGPRGNNYGSSSGMEEQQDTIFVSGISENTSEDDLKDYFGAIGLIKIDKKTRKPKIWVYKDKETGKPKGEATITYDDPPTASSAINWFNGKELNGSVLKVELAQRKNNYLASGNRNNNFGGNRGGNRDFDRRGGQNDNRRVDNSQGGGPPRDGDWVCSECQNNNFAWRDSCNRCKSSKPGGGNSGDNSSGDRRNNNLPYERRGGNQMNGSRDRGSFGGSRNNDNRNQNRGSFGGRNDQRGGRNGGPMRNNDNRRANPY